MQGKLCLRKAPAATVHAAGGDYSLRGKPPNPHKGTPYNPSSQAAGEASLGMRQSPRGERATEPIFGPSGRQERLNCWEKNRR